ncbi:hypothetical protein N9L27_05845 [Candidatus Poseidoniales archaeon]|nr:hypothetical protein [Candidatus Poseidoniales archaeon]MDA8748261.1 hypothetical protein [Candidatus Poseidoniales archaeon]
MGCILTCTKSFSDIVSEDGLSYSDNFSFAIPTNSVLKKIIKRIQSSDRFLLYSGKSSVNTSHRGVFFAIYEASRDVHISGKEFVLSLDLISEVEPRLSMKEISDISDCDGIAMFNRCNGQRVITQIQQIAF